MDNISLQKAKRKSPKKLGDRVPSGKSCVWTYERIAV